MNLERVCSRAVTPSDCDKNKGGRDILGECLTYLNCVNIAGDLCVWGEGIEEAESGGACDNIVCHIGASYPDLSHILFCVLLFFKDTPQAMEVVVVVGE